MKKPRAAVPAGLREFLGGVLGQRKPRASRHEKARAGGSGGPRSSEG
jgi:hypothetical protein